MKPLFSLKYCLTKINIRFRNRSAAISTNLIDRVKRKFPIKNI